MNRLPSNIVKGYASLAELVGVAVNGKSDMDAKARASRQNSNGWAGGTYDDAKRIALSGDLEGARRLRADVLTAVNAMVAGQPRLDPVYRLDEGRWIDVARFVKGEPECWGDMEEAAPIQRKGAAVVVNVAASSGVSAGALDRLGVSIGSAILGLQAQGYAVILHAAEKIGGEGTLLVHAPINPGASALDVSHMSVILRPWFLRRVIFSLEETMEVEIRDRFGICNYGGYGTPGYISKADAKTITGRDDAVVINVNDAVKNPDAVKRLILDQIKGGK